MALPPASKQAPHDPHRRTWLIASSCLGLAGGAALAVPLVGSLLPVQDSAPANTVDVDITDLPPGQKQVVAWRGKPVWIVKRTPEMIERLQTHAALLADPDSQRTGLPTPRYAQNPGRSRTPEVFVCVGVCSHLGCAPVDRFTPGAQAGLPAHWPGGFVCPCHNSLFDLAGRVFKGGNAPDNLQVPPYQFITPTLLRIGEATDA